MVWFYADENFDFPVTQRLRTLGHDVLTVQEAGEQGGNDARVLAYATAAGRIVLTFDRRDFERLHRADPAHAGIVELYLGPRCGCPGRPNQSGSHCIRLGGRLSHSRQPALFALITPRQVRVPPLSCGIWVLGVTDVLDWGGGWPGSHDRIS